MSNLRAIGHRDQRHLHGNRAFTSGGLAKHGSTHQDLLTANAVTFIVDGKFYSRAAMTAIDVSALAVVNERGETVVDEPLPAGGTRVWLLALNTAGTPEVVIVPGRNENEAGYLHVPSCPDGLAPFGAVKVHNGTGSDFVFGTTALNAANVTATYHNLSVVPDTL